MRHAFIVVGCDGHSRESVPSIRLRDDESLREIAWYACADQEKHELLLDDRKSIFSRLLHAPLLAYQFYLLVHSTKLWSGKRPLILVQDRRLSSRVAAYAGKWGGGDVVHPESADNRPLGPTRYLLGPDGRLELRVD